MTQKRTKEQTVRKTPLLDLFPEIKPYSSGYMAVDKPHEIYWEQSGNPDGVPVLYLHGGPGAGCSANANRFFDPDFYRIILFDQRGSGRSTPPACLENNTTNDLIGDIEQLRGHLKIDQWHVFGGSWGSTLALSYAAEKPAKVLSMALRGIFLLEQQGVDWLLYHNKNVFPEAWEQFVSIIPEDRHNDLLEAYYERLTSSDKKIQMEAAINWSLYESACASLIPNYEIVTTEEQRAQALNISSIECHYFRNNMIPESESLLKKIDKFRHIPSTIIHGRYDMVCPILSAHRLHNAWPEADFIIVPDAGHSANEPAIRSRLIEATENMKTI
ncbi:MAG TPA: prolyl aminopeptidase [Alphaproteobacteria bacterium]|nr:prolyl aminopeptidase [Alphaproteobacteria bacterium]